MSNQRPRTAFSDQRSNHEQRSATNENRSAVSRLGRSHWTRTFSPSDRRSAARAKTALGTTPANRGPPSLRSQRSSPQNWLEAKLQLRSPRLPALPSESKARRGKVTPLRTHQGLEPSKTDDTATAHPRARKRAQGKNCNSTPTVCTGSVC